MSYSNDNAFSSIEESKRSNTEEFEENIIEKFKGCSIEESKGKNFFFAILIAVFCLCSMLGGINVSYKLHSTPSIITPLETTQWCDYNEGLILNGSGVSYLFDSIIT
ncbi:hypothetical protein RhiirA4_428590 [Rhizophagus irregularis]|uniref:Uncharacterized protein n=1 Tax=Rhizophagus irregularis TaxID=588596 RepID=A0A2I1HDG3_9GLOM|nr:hypothetical protein RhiirA4_428590 [Rhizophagus irregularis]